MNTYEAASIIEQLLNGIDPCTGEVLPESHVCAEPLVMRAFHLSITALRAYTGASATVNSKDLLPRNRNGRLNAGRPWTDVDNGMLEYLFNSGVSIDDICSQMERRERGVKKQLVYLGLTTDEAPKSTQAGARKSQPNAGKPWTKDDDSKLRELYQHDCSTTEMAEELGRSELSIIYRLERNGLTSH